MSNKSRLQTNNNNLQTLINKANALPDAGSGGGGNGGSEMYSVTIEMSSANAMSLICGLIYIKSDGTLDSDSVIITSSNKSATLSVQKGLLCIWNYLSMPSSFECGGGVESVTAGQEVAIFNVVDNGFIAIS